MTKTRDYFVQEFELEQPPAETHLVTPIKVRNAKRKVRVSTQSIGGARKPDTLRKFLMYDKKVLRFKAMWDDSKSLFYGEKRFFTLHYYLSDDNMELRELYENNSGRRSPVLNRNRV